MLHTCHKVTGRMLWANLHLLFWLSLIPFATGWMGENHFAAMPTALYGVRAADGGHRLLLCSQQTIIASQGPDSVLRQAVGRDWKGIVSPILYVSAILIAFTSHWASKAIYVLVALMWLVPDQRIEKALARREA